MFHGLNNFLKQYEYVLTISLALVGAFVGVMVYVSSLIDAKTDLYIDLKMKYSEISKTKNSNKHFKEVYIEDCSLLRKEGLLVGDAYNFDKSCTIKYYNNNKFYYSIEAYWKHSFNEWFSASELGLADDLWEEYYKGAIFNALNSHIYQVTACKMLNGGSSFAGKVSEFKSALRGMYAMSSMSNIKMINKYRNRWNTAERNKEIDIKTPFSERGMHIPGPESPECLNEGMQEDYFHNHGYQSKDALALYYHFTNNVLHHLNCNTCSDRYTYIDKKQLVDIINNARSDMALVVNDTGYDEMLYARKQAKFAKIAVIHQSYLPMYDLNNK